MTPFRAGPEYARWPEVLRLIKDAFAYMDARVEQPSSAHRLTIPMIADSAATGAVFLIEEAGDPVASVFCRSSRDVADAYYLGKLAVDGACRGRGLARKLVTAAEDEARRHGYPALVLETRIELTENIAAFTRLGFRKTGEAAHEGFDRPTIVTMRKDLASARQTP